MRREGREVDMGPIPQVEADEEEEYMKGPLPPDHLQATEPLPWQVVLARRQV
jgi:hypothetical protein